MYCTYLRDTYLENRLKDKLDFAAVRAPLFVVATREDHIVPWRSAYRSLGLFAGSTDRHFVLGASGHIAGIVNPPDKKRRSHWAFGDLPADPEQGLAAAPEIKGSWWPRWMKWLDEHGGGKRKAPAKAGNTKFKPIEPAPGRYVRQKA
jgi:polyhydroxyalkanoate synthase